MTSNAHRCIQTYKHPNIEHKRSAAEAEPLNKLSLYKSMAYIVFFCFFYPHTHATHSTSHAAQDAATQLPRAALTLANENHAGRRVGTQRGTRRGRNQLKSERHPDHPSGGIQERTPPEGHENASDNPTPSGHQAYSGGRAPKTRASRCHAREPLPKGERL